jgi:hypothetical protein
MNFSLGYPGRDGIGGGNLKLRLPPVTAVERRKIKFSEYNRLHLETLFPKNQDVILTEERLLGKAKAFYKGRFYREASMNAHFLNDFFEGNIVQVLVVVRSYVSLFKSCYRKQAEDNLVADFSELSKGFFKIKRSWTDVIKDISQAIPDANIKVVEMGARGKSRDLLSRLLGTIPEGGFCDELESLNSSPTDSAVLALQTRYKRGESLCRDDWQAVIREFADIKDDLGVTKYDPQLEKILKDRYARDLENIPKIKGVTFIG